MTNHIPPHKLMAQDLVDIFDLGPEDDRHPEPVVLRMHAVDAKHAMAVEPERYMLELEAPRAIPRLVKVEETEQTDEKAEKDKE